MSSATRSVSARREPGGSSTASSVRPVSSAGRKPDGSSRVDAMDATNRAMPAASVSQRCRTDQPTRRV